MKNDAYKQQMDQVRVPEEKARETLRLMLEENKRLREKEEKRALRPAGKRLPAFVLAAAACLALAFFGVRAFRSAPSIYSFRMGDLPVAAGPRGEDTQTVPFETAFSATPEKLFPDCQAEETEAREFILDEKPAHQADLALQKGDIQLHASVTDFEPALFTLLGKNKTAKAGNAFLGKDAETGRLYAAYEKDGLFVTLYAENIKDSAFTEAVREIAEK